MITLCLLLAACLLTCMGQVSQKFAVEGWRDQPDGTPHPVGHVLKNPELAAVLRELAAMGPLALHEGPVARAIVAKVQQHPRMPGALSLDDLKAYAGKYNGASIN